MTDATPHGSRDQAPTTTRLSLERIRDARRVIDPVHRDTPQFEAAALNEELGCRVQLKVETLNPVRCFKGRGVDTVMASLRAAGAGRSVVCASAGNLGQALAASGSREGVAVTVFAARTASPMKIERMRALGATVHLVGDDIERPRELAQEFAASEGALLVEDSLNLDTCEGAATIGLELAEAPVRLDAVLIALGGGALASGVGYVLRELCPETEVIAIQPVGAPAMALSWRARAVVTTETIDTIADGVAGRFPIPEVLDDLLQVVGDVVLVDEAAIVAGMRCLFEFAGLVVEPSAALGVAAILADRDRYRGKTVGTIICGSNVDPSDFERWVFGVT